MVWAMPCTSYMQGIEQGEHVGAEYQGSALAHSMHTHQLSFELADDTPSHGKGFDLL